MAAKGGVLEEPLYEFVVFHLGDVLLLQGTFALVHDLVVVAVGGHRP